LQGEPFGPGQPGRPGKRREAFGVAAQFHREHPRRLRLLSTILGWGDLRDDAAVRPAAVPLLRVERDHG
jgi:hypothetical protein